MSPSKKSLILGAEHWGCTKGQGQRDGPPGTKLSGLCPPSLRLTPGRDPVGTWRVSPLWGAPSALEGWGGLQEQDSGDYRKDLDM